MKERVLLEGVVSGIKFPCKGTLVPVAAQPERQLPEAPAGILYTEATRDYEPFSVKNLLPEQRWLVSAGKKGKSARQCHVLELLERAPYEVDAPCPHAENCGGCLYQTVPYELQLMWKQAQIRELLAGVPGVEEAEFMPIVPSPLALRYRNKMEFSFGDEEKDGPLTLGLHKRGSFHDILSTPDCALVSDSLGRIARETESFFRCAGVNKYRVMTGEGVLRHLVLRQSFLDGGILVNLVTSSEELGMDEIIQAWVRRLLELDLPGNSKIQGILHTVNDRRADVVQADSLRVLYGSDFLMEELLGLRFKISPFSFFQTNTRGAEKLYGIVRDFAGDVAEKTVFDLYSGTGTMAQMMAAAGAKQVVGIEIVPEAVEAARENALLNGLTNCEFITGDVLKEIENVTEKPDLVILDPPRDGIHPKALPKLLAFEPKSFIYVSCKPTSLVRDLPFFTAAGYHIDAIRCCDMFPETPHVETVCLLSNRKPDTKVRIDVDLEDYYRIKDAKKNQD